MTAVVQEAVTGVRLVKGFGGEAYEERRFREASDRLARGLKRVARTSFLAQPITETIGTGIAVAVLWIGYGLWHAGARWLAPEHAGAGMPWTVLLLLLASAFGLRALRRRRQ